MRVRWGGSGFDDLKCTQLTSYSYSAQLLWQFNSFLPVLLMLACQGWSGGRRPLNCSIILAEMLSGSENSHNYTWSWRRLLRRRSSLDLMTNSAEFSPTPNRIGIPGTSETIQSSSHFYSVSPANKLDGPFGRYSYCRHFTGHYCHRSPIREHPTKRLMGNISDSTGLRSEKSP